MASTINSDLESISEWGYQNLVKFNASKTQFLPISLSTNPSDPQILFEDSLTRHCRTKFPSISSSVGKKKLSWNLMDSI